MDDFVTKIYSDGFADVEEMKEEFNKKDLLYKNICL
jgi:hypothetical protein